MKIQKANYAGMQKISGKVQQKKTDEPKDGVVLGGTPKEIDFLKMGDVSKTKSSNFSNLDLSAAPYIISGAALGGALAGVSSLPAPFIAFGTIGGAVAGGAMKDQPAFAKCIGVGTFIGASIGAGIGVAKGFPASAMIGGGIGAAAGSICAALYEFG